MTHKVEIITAETAQFLTDTLPDTDVQGCEETVGFIGRETPEVNSKLIRTLLFGEVHREMNQSEIAEVLRVSHQHISVFIQDIFERLKKRIRNHASILEFVQDHENSTC